MTWLKSSISQQKRKRLTTRLKSFAAGIVIAIHFGLILMVFIVWVAVITVRLQIINWTDKRAK